MNEVAPVTAHSTGQRDTAITPLYFGPTNRLCLGWFHDVPTTLRPRDAGLLICPPFGYEAVCAHRSLRRFAISAARAGIPAFRFDYDGTGDSAGSHRDPWRLQAWTESTRCAIEELKERSGVRSVFLLGIRLGATIGALAGTGRDDVSGLIAVVPVWSGRAWLREARALEAAMGLPGPPPAASALDIVQEIAGYGVTDETRSELEALDLTRISDPPAAEVLLLDRDDMLTSNKWANHLRSVGVCVQQGVAVGYALMMRDPHETVPPAAMIHEVTEWLKGRAAPADRTTHEYRDRVTIARMPDHVEERIGYLGQDESLFAVTTVRTDHAPSRAVVLLNAGAIPHTGPGRLYVDLARRWAARGYLVIRYDQFGIGDSENHAVDPEGTVYATSALPALQFVLEHIAIAWNVDSIETIGICSGAYHGLKAAAAGMPLTRASVINPLVFFWEPGMSLANPTFKDSLAAAQLKESVKQWEKWKKVINGQVDLLEWYRVAGRRLANHLTRLAHNVARVVGHSLSKDLGVELRDIERRGVQVLFVFSVGDPGEDLLRFEAGWSLPGLLRRGTVKVRHVAGADHTFTREWTKVALIDVLESELGIQ